MLYNLLNREFKADKPNEKWLTDVTEFKYYVGIEVGVIGWTENDDHISEWFFELPKDGTEGLSLIADCVTADPAIEGNWSVTFPLKTISAE